MPNLLSDARPIISGLFPSQEVISSRLHRQDSNYSHLTSKVYKSRRYVKKEATLLVYDFFATDKNIHLFKRHSLYIRRLAKTHKRTNYGKNVIGKQLQHRQSLF